MNLIRVRHGRRELQRACLAEAGRRQDSIFIPQSQDYADVLDHTTGFIRLNAVRLKVAVKVQRKK